MLESTYKRPEDKPDDLALVRLSGWHTDDSYFARPAKATMLQSLALPSSGGETRFCNTRRAWEVLDEEMKARIDGAQAVHGYDTPRAPGRAETRTAEEAAETPDVLHPLVRTHEDTGRKAIYFNPEPHRPRGRSGAGGERRAARRPLRAHDRRPLPLRP